MTSSDIDYLRDAVREAEQAVLASDEDVRALPGVLAKVLGPEAEMSASDAHKHSAAVLAVNSRLHDHLRATRMRLARALAQAKYGSGEFAGAVK